MKNFAIRVVVNGVALWVAALVVNGVHLGEGDTSWTTKTLTILFVALIFGVINAFIKPIVKLLTLPFYVLTLGLMAFLVNAFMLELTEWFSGVVGLGFHIDDFFWSAIGAAVVVTIVVMLLETLVDRD